MSADNLKVPAPEISISRYVCVRFWRAFAPAVCATNTIAGTCLGQRAATFSYTLSVFMSGCVHCCPLLHAMLTQALPANCLAPTLQPRIDIPQQNHAQEHSSSAPADAPYHARAKFELYCQAIVVGAALSSLPANCQRPKRAALWRAV